MGPHGTDTLTHIEVLVFAKMLKMLPVIKPAFKIYPELLKERGLESILNVG